MEELNGVTIYWLLSIGLFVGLCVDLLLMNRSIGLIRNAIWGAIGSVIIGVIMIILNMFAPLMYAALGAVALLFLINVFSFEEVHKEAIRATQNIKKEEPN
jgi:uncharacterized membrane protein YeaQ/YmgE (transglycosylase-associated protein family)